MSRILLRTLSRKSIIPAGKNAGLSVADVLTKCKSDLIYSYFNYANISYAEDILDELRIKPEDRIAKPGKDPSKYQFYIERNFNAFVTKKFNSLSKKDEEFNYGKFLRIKKGILKSKAKAKYKGLIERERKFFSKGAMQRRNHGNK